VGEFDEKFKFNTFSQAPNGGDISRKINFPRIIISTETFSTLTSKTRPTCFGGNLKEIIKGSS
jgi:hypothetical protein